MTLMGHVLYFKENFVIMRLTFTFFCLQNSVKQWFAYKKVGMKNYDEQP